MNRKYLLPALLLTVFTMCPSYGAKTEVTNKDSNKDFNFEGDTIHAVVPSGWTAMTGALNVPATMVSEKGNQNVRAVIEVVPYESTPEKDSFAKLKNDPENFFDKKEEWLENTGGESISYIPFKTEKKDGAKIYSIGIKYHSPHGDFLDKTYFVYSKGNRSLMVKVLMPLDLEKSQAASVNRAIASISEKN